MSVLALQHTRAYTQLMSVKLTTHQQSAMMRRRTVPNHKSAGVSGLPELVQLWIVVAAAAFPSTLTKVLVPSEKSDCVFWCCVEMFSNTLFFSFYGRHIVKMQLFCW